MARRRLAIGLTFLALAASGCDRGAKPATPDAGAAAQGTSLLTPEDAKLVLVKVGARTITLGDFAAALEHMDQFDRMRYQSAARRKELLAEMINVELLAQEAVAKGWDKDPLTQQEIREVLRDAMLAEARQGVPQPSEIPEGEVRAYFEAHKADFREPERRRLSGILLGDAKSAAEVLEAAKKTKTAAEWGALVQTRSLDPTAKANVPIDLAGDLGFVSPPASGPNENPRVSEDVRAAAFEIGKPNEVLARVVQVKDRFHVIRLTARTDAHEATYGEAERRIRVALVQERMREKERELLDRLRGQVKVEVDQAALARVVVGGDGGAHE